MAVHQRTCSLEEEEEEEEEEGGGKEEEEEAHTLSLIGSHPGQGGERRGDG